MNENNISAASRTKERVAEFEQLASSASSKSLREPKQTNGRDSQEVTPVVRPRNPKNQETMQLPPATAGRIKAADQLTSRAAVTTRDDSPGQADGVPRNDAPRAERRQARKLAADAAKVVNVGNGEVKPTSKSEAQGAKQTSTRQESNSIADGKAGGNLASPARQGQLPKENIQNQQPQPQPQPQPRPVSGQTPGRPVQRPDSELPPPARQLADHSAQQAASDEQVDNDDVFEEAPAQKLAKPKAKEPKYSWSKDVQELKKTIHELQDLLLELEEFLKPGNTIDQRFGQLNATLDAADQAVERTTILPLVCKAEYQFTQLQRCADFILRHRPPGDERAQEAALYNKHLKEALDKFKAEIEALRNKYPGEVPSATEPQWRVPSVANGNSVNGQTDRASPSSLDQDEEAQISQQQSTEEIEEQPAAATNRKSASKPSRSKEKTDAAKVVENAKTLAKKEKEKGDVAETDKENSAKVEKPKGRGRKFVEWLTNEHKDAATSRKNAAAESVPDRNETANTINTTNTTNAANTTSTITGPKASAAGTGVSATGGVAKAKQTPITNTATTTTTTTTSPPQG